MVTQVRLIAVELPAPDEASNGDSPCDQGQYGSRQPAMPIRSRQEQNDAGPYIGNCEQAS